MQLQHQCKCRRHKRSFCASLSIQSHKPRRVSWHPCSWAQLDSSDLEWCPQRVSTPLCNGCSPTIALMVRLTTSCMISKSRSASFPLRSLDTGFLRIFNLKHETVCHDVASVCSSSCSLYLKGSEWYTNSLSFPHNQEFSTSLTSEGSHLYQFDVIMYLSNHLAMGWNGLFLA